MKAPFIWFGGKRRVADIVWQALGDVDNYVEPFAGSLAVLLARPEYHDKRCETVNDKDGYIANFWRALAAAPDEVAKYADWPVNEIDLTARHLWLVNSGRERLLRMQGDPDFCDAKVAGWWVWGINAWIGGGWCSGNGPWRIGPDGSLVDGRQCDNLPLAGRGVNRKRPHLGNRPVAEHGFGSSISLPCPIQEYFKQLSARLRRVRVCCGDWQRVLTDGATSFGSTVGVFLDPPYDLSLRDNGCYNVDAAGISHEVREWCISKGDDPRFRIVLAGYEDEHAGKMPDGWLVHAYKANKCYGTSKGGGRNEANRHKERLWFSPSCNPVNGARQKEMAELKLAIA